MSKKPLSGYELTIISKNDWSDEGLGKFREKITAIVKDHDGEIVKAEDWGKRKLAYKIQNESRCRYTHLVFTGNPKVIAEVERNIKLQDKIIRFMSVKVSDEFDAAAYQKRRDQLQEQIENSQVY